MQKLIVLQSLWAMERRHADGVEPPLEANVARIAEAGFDGVSAHCTSRDEVRRLSSLLKPANLVAEGQCFPRTVDELKPVLEIAAEFGIHHHIAVQPLLRPHGVAQAAAVLEGWQRLAEEAAIPVLIETHRGRMTNDLPFTLDLLDACPDLPILADLSHYVVGQEFELPVPEHQQAAIRRILDNSRAFHGRVAGSGQVQIELSFAHHRPWIEQFVEWWRYGFRSWRRRAGPHATLAFTCELGPRPYAIADRDGNDTTDRWVESLQLKAIAEGLWAG